MNELEQQEFDYSLVDNETATKLEKYEKQLNRIYNSYSVEVGEVLYHAQQELSSYGDGTFIKWAESKGIKERSIYNYINAFKFLQQLQKPEDKEVFLSQPKRLQYAMSKPSAKEELIKKYSMATLKLLKNIKKWNAKLKSTSNNSNNATNKTPNSNPKWNKRNVQKRLHVSNSKMSRIENQK